jgi:hypothetical protein
MGAWGPGIFADDDASDARENFKLYLGDAQDIAAATDAIARDNGASFDAPEHNSAFWLGLALTQWSAGWLDARVQAAALRLIDEGLDLAKWAEGPPRMKRAAALRTTRAKLVSPPPPPKRIPAPWPIQLADFTVGEILGRRLPGGRLAVMKVIAFRPTTSLKVRGPAVRVQHWLKTEMPNATEAAQLDYLRHPLGPNKIQTVGSYTLAAPRSAPLDPALFIRPGIIVPLRPGEECVSYTCVSTWADYTLDDMLAAAIERFWDDPKLPPTASAPWYVHAKARAPAPDDLSSPAG